MGGDNGRINNDYLPSGVGGQSASRALPPMSGQFVDYQGQANPEEDYLSKMLEDLYRRFALRVSNEGLNNGIR